MYYWLFGCDLTMRTWSNSELLMVFISLVHSHISSPNDAVLWHVGLLVQRLDGRKSVVRRRPASRSVRLCSTACNSQILWVPRSALLFFICDNNGRDTEVCGNGLVIPIPSHSHHVPIEERESGDLAVLMRVSSNSRGCVQCHDDRNFHKRRTAEKWTNVYKTISIVIGLLSDSVAMMFWLHEKSLSTINVVVIYKELDIQTSYKGSQCLSHGKCRKH